MERWYVSDWSTRSASESERGQPSCIPIVSAVAAALFIPFEETHRIHLEHAAYHGELIKQASELA